MSCLSVVHDAARLATRLLENGWLHLGRRSLTSAPVKATVRALHHDGRNRLSNFWTAKTESKAASNAALSSHERLLRFGFVQQAHSGIFHLLPLGLRVQDKLERLIDKHMRSLCASKVSLSSFSSEALWKQSGRLEGRDSEFFRLEDRKGKRFLLSPTHEEEITSIVRNLVVSYKQLPLRLYQVSRKYRDEARPRHGLMRGREFLMKDLYTFDTTEQEALTTYEDVREAYCAFLDELKLPYLVASADSGNMGGDLSHEYHFSSPSGEDVVVQCSNCGYAVNEEIFVASYDASKNTTTPQMISTVTHGISKDRTKLVKIMTPADKGEVNWRAVKQLCSDVDTSVESPKELWDQYSKANPETKTTIITLTDPRLGGIDCDSAGSEVSPVLLTQVQPHDTCPKCSQEALQPVQAVEIGHTFHLSTRYSEPLEARVTDAENRLVTLHMGCHGIGVTRLIGTIASMLGDDQGVTWPLAIAPFSVFITTTNNKKTGAKSIESVYDELFNNLHKTNSDMDMIIDDRNNNIGAAFGDAWRMGCSFVIVLGRTWFTEQKVELQCRRLNYNEVVSYPDLPEVILDLAAKL